MPFASRPPPDPDARPWLDVLYARSPHPDRCYYSESRWCRRRAPDVHPTAPQQLPAPQLAPMQRPGTAA
jgi:hypothetical protein